MFFNCEPWYVRTEEKNLRYRIFFVHDMTVTIMMQWKKTYEIEICNWFQSH